jgi:DNA polymerase-3 subunit alpha/error-prone DNA polymerase
MAAVISNQGGFYSTFAYVSEARRMGLRIRPPHINQSEIHWTGRGDTMCVGLLSIKGLAAATRTRIISQRHQSVYDSLHDVLDRVRPDDAEARALIHCGALDAFSPNGNRASLIWELVRWQKFTSSNAATGMLFPDPPASHPPPLPPEDPRERLRREFAVLGFLCDRHPMELLAPATEKMGIVKAVQLPRFLGQRVRLGAWLITGKKVHTQHGEPMEFLTFEDETGLIETIFFPQAYRRFCHIIDRGRPYLLTGRVEQDWGAITLTVETVEPIRDR